MRQHNSRKLGELLTCHRTQIVLPAGLELAAEGHTDSTGSDEFNHRLSDQRASRVREIFVERGLAGDAVIAQSLGK
jgi:outer membrane protein OmpA-like peptidoglycan-associated protein